jgi:hypothetical protein
MTRRGHGHLRGPFSSTPAPLSLLLLLLLLISLSQMHFRIPQILPLPKDQKLKIKIKPISDPQKNCSSKIRRTSQRFRCGKTLKTFAESFFPSCEEEEDEEEEEEQRLLLHTRVAETLKTPRRQGWRIQVAKSSMRQNTDD